MITPLQLSGGVKTLLLVANDKSNKHSFNVSTCGDTVIQLFGKTEQFRQRATAKES